MDLSVSPEHINRVLQDGAAARDLLEQPAFLEVVDFLTAQHLAGLSASPPGAKGLEAREYHHLMQYALTEIVSELVMRRDAAAGLEEQLKRMSEEL